jgi:membrane associated rhomboid family serine protease/Zn-finger nucleic acid-binding protein
MRSRGLEHCWICDDCKGVVADLPSLRNAAPRDRITAIEAAIREGVFSERSCPKCALRMTRASVRGGTGILEVDGCSSCGFVWLDPGELRGLQSTEASGDAGFEHLSPAQRQALRAVRMERSSGDHAGELTLESAGLLFGVPYPERVRNHETEVYVTCGLCSVIVLASAAAFLAGDFGENVRRFGMVPAAVKAGSWSGLITHFFLHGDVFHLAGNMLFLLMFGSRVEPILKGIRYLLLIAFATVSGALLHCAFARDPSIPLIGASGGISGLIAAHAVLRPRATVRVVWFRQLLTMPAWGAFLTWLLLQTIGMTKQIFGITSVSAAAHIGGAAAGFALGVMWKSRAQAIEPALL